MHTTPWVRGPVGLDRDRRLTRTGLHTVLIMVPTVTAGTRLLDLLPLFDGDHRIQVVFTAAHQGETWHGLDDFVRSCGGVILPWGQARHHRWDLALSASHRHIEQVHGPLLVLPHGAGAAGARRHSRKGGATTITTTGLDHDLLTYRGRIVPAAITLNHQRELDILRHTCPAAVDRAIITGDICLDRLRASAPHRPHYRAALGVADNEQLVTVSSTWYTDSTFGRHPELYQRLTEESANSRTRVAAILHPNIWSVHGARQIHTWLAPAIHRGLMIIPPERGWQATMIASDTVIGDHGSTTSYAAAIGRPVHLATNPDAPLRPGTAAHALAHLAPQLDHRNPLLPQIAGYYVGKRWGEVAGLISSRQGRAAHLFRRSMYSLLGLTEPPWPAALAAAQTPRLPERGF